MACQNLSCTCKSPTAKIWHQFFSLWEMAVSIEDERDIIFSAEKGTGVSYSSTMVDRKPDT